ncbi:Sedoheptulokinase [Labeo rohita]|uniref:Sedoheptulokinase n=1 Tax=Labeo rohita TaxID=84645 RepID=A0ABQ8MP62_LABRO|nr:Sedoheptulokinase [Labeo rohita]
MAASVSCSAGFVLGMDLGTTSVKVVLLDAQSKTVTDSRSFPTNSDISSTSDIHAKEQDPALIIAALNQCMEALPKDKLKKVKCIGICGQMHGIVLWKSKSGCKWLSEEEVIRFIPEDVSQLITWQDGRCSADFLSSLPKADSHLSVATGFGCATIFWYMKHSLKDAGFPVQLLPVVVESGAVAGHTSSEWYGIPAHTAVGAALGDFQCSVYSCMTDKGDAAQLTFSMPAEFIPPNSPDPFSPVAYFPYLHGSYLAVAASLNGGNVMATFVRMLDSWMKEFGERHDPTSRASASQISPSNLSLGHVTRALCRGVIENMATMMPPQSLQAAGVKCIIGSGSALSCNTVLQQEVERVFPFPVVYGKNVDSAAGVAMVFNDLT